jgi:two-component system, LytTR family, sensor kinase
MSLYKHIALIAVLLVCAPTCWAQPSGNTEPPYHEIETGGKGLLDRQMKVDAKAKLTSIYTVGGFVTIKTGPRDTPQGRIEYSGYYKPNSPDEEKIVGQASGYEMYLKIDQEFYLDVTDSTGGLIYRYAFKRIRRVPDIVLTRRDGEQKKAIPATGDSSRITLPPGEVLNVGTVKTSDFADSQIAFTLINLKTKQTEYHEENFDVADLKLMADTEYQLRFNYVIQPESAAVYYIQVKSHWYQSTITYIVVAILLAGALFWGVTSGLKHKVRSAQKKQQKLEQDALRLQSMLNPHFTFNALNSIQGLMNTDRIEEANHYLQEFSTLLRKTLNKNQQVFNSLDQELEVMRMYLRLEALRFNFAWNIEVGDSLDTTVIEIPTLILQPLIENSIKHGISHLGDQGQLYILCKAGKESGSLVIVVKDNGKWQDKGSGYGLSLTEERIRTINQLKKEQTIDLTFNKQTGTEAILTFHHWLNN